MNRAIADFRYWLDQYLGCPELTQVDWHLISRKVDHFAAQDPDSTWVRHKPEVKVEPGFRNSFRTLDTGMPTPPPALPPMQQQPRLVNFRFEGSEPMLDPIKPEPELVEAVVALNDKVAATFSRDMANAFRL